ncbi:LCP family protein [Sporomusa aerivorans]|uniref:LCP family protein n=1 Tax=Sporomusa aerivorans TaxID=204936 RepID=UPI00352A4A6B
MAQNSNKTLPGQKRRLRKGRAALLAAIFLLIVTGITYAIFAEEDNSKTVSGAATQVKVKKINILVLGTDEREEDAGRSDTTFVATIDTVEKKITMLSIPRDTRIKIPGHGWDKLNHAYAFGGSELSKAAVENLLGIKIDYTVAINVNGFVRMLDAIGGVTIDVDKRMQYADPYDDNGGLYIDLYPGVQRLNGKTAIEYVRYRDEEGDIGRVARQQKFLKALLQEITKPQLATKLPELVKQASTSIRTDMPKSEMLTLIPVISDAAKTGLKTEWVAGTPLWIQDISYWLPDIKELRAKVAQIQAIKVDEKYNRLTDLLAKEYQQSIPKETEIAEVPPVEQVTAEKKAGTPAKTSPEPKSKTETEATQLTQKNDFTAKPAPVATNHKSVVHGTNDGTVSKNTTSKTTSE